LQKKFPLRVTPYYLSLINPNNKEDPLRIQTIPSVNELLKEKDEELIAWDKESLFCC